MLDSRRARLGIKTTAVSDNDGDEQEDMEMTDMDASLGSDTMKSGTKGLLIIPSNYLDPKEALRRFKEKREEFRPSEPNEQQLNRIKNIQVALKEKKRRSDEAREKSKQLISRSGGVKVKSSKQSKSEYEDENENESNEEDEHSQEAKSNVSKSSKKAEKDKTAEKDTKANTTSDKDAEKKQSASSKSSVPKLDLSFGEVVADTNTTKFSERATKAQKLKAKVEKLKSEGKEEEAKKIMEEIEVQNAIERARTGKDIAILDEKVIKKREKKEAKLKKISGENWKKREDEVKKAQSERIKKREENIRKKVETKLAKQRGTYKKEKKSKKPDDHKNKRK